MTSRIAEGAAPYDGSNLQRGDEAIIDELVRTNPALWRGRSRNPVSTDSLDSGFDELNAILPGGGWPLRSVMEIVVDEWGNGELQVLLPLMRYLGRQGQLALIAPPYLPYAPALHMADIALDRLLIIDRKIPAKDKWWCAEKMLRHGDCGLVMVWPERRYVRTWASQVRRLQVAAAMGNNIGVIFNRGKPADTPVSLRLKLGYCESGVSIEILKSRFSWQRGASVIPRSMLQTASGA